MSVTTVRGGLTTSSQVPLTYHPATAITHVDLGPTLALVLRAQHLIRSISRFLCWQAYLLAAATSNRALLAARTLAWQILLVARVGGYRGAVMSRVAWTRTWDSKTVRALRKKMMYDFAFFILGSGNGLVLLLFWPGWLVVGGAAWAAVRICG
jgi:hypothetical protein